MTNISTALGFEHDVFCEVPPTDRCVEGFRRESGDAWAEQRQRTIASMLVKMLGWDEEVL